MKSKAENNFLELLRKSSKSKDEIQAMQDYKSQFENELKEEQLALITELKKKDLPYNDIWEMVNTQESYAQGVDILISHLPKNYHDKNKEGIVRALIKEEAKGKAVPALISEYERTPVEKDNLRWVIAYAITNLMTKADLNWLIKAVKDKNNGPSRSALVLALGNFKNDTSESVLIDLLDDKDVLAQVLATLGKLKCKKAKLKIQQISDNTIDPVIKLEATKALKLIR